MMLGPVQVLVVGVPEGGRAEDVTEPLAAMPADGPVRCLDVFEVTVAEDGTLALSAAPAPLSLPLFAELVDEGTEVTPAEGMWHVGQVVPPGARAVVALLEHRWALGLREALQGAGATLLHETWLDEDDRGTLEGLLRR